MSQQVLRREEQTPESYRDRVPVLSPPVDIFENDQEILLLADIPGVAEDGLTITLEKNELTLHARRKSEEEPGSVLARDYREGDYHRSFMVPQGIDGEKVEAQLKNGVLHVHLPKSDGLKPRKIQVTVG